MPSLKAYQQLFSGSRAGDPARVAAALANGVDPNALDAEGHSPLARACSAGSERCVALLLQAGASVDGSGSKGHSPLLAAINAHSLPCLALLAGRGVDLASPRGNFGPPLLWAARVGALSCAEAIARADSRTIDASDPMSDIHPLALALASRTGGHFELAEFFEALAERMALEECPDPAAPASPSDRPRL